MVSRVTLQLSYKAFVKIKVKLCLDYNISMRKTILHSHSSDFVLLTGKEVWSQIFSIQNIDIATLFEN